jgi:hypothetical protein
MLIHKMRKFFLISIVLFAGHVSSQTLTEEQAIATALKANYNIRISRNDSLLYEMYDQYAYGAFLPAVNGQTNLGFLNNDQRQKLADGSIRERNNLRSENAAVSVALNWTLFDGMKMFISRDKLNANYELSKLNLQQQVSSTVAEVINAYYAIVREKQQLLAIEEQMALYDERVKLADQKLRSGLGAKPEWLQAKVDLNSQKAAKLEESARLQKLKQSLNLLMAVPVESEYDVTDSIPIDKELATGEKFTSMESSNPELKTALQDYKVAGLTLKEVKAGRYPTLNFNATYNFSRFKNIAVINEFTPLQNRNLGINYGFSATLPLFNGFQVRRQIKEAVLDMEYRGLLLEYKTRQARAAVSQALLEFKIELAVLDLEEESTQLAKENTFISSERFRMGITGSLELRESQKSLQDAYNRLIAARYAAKLAETELKRLNGELVK